MRTMYDGISPLRLPQGADLYAGYDDGRWPDAGAIAARFPGKKVLRITTDPKDEVGDVLDVERGDATPTQAPAWVKARRDAGAWPSVYCSYSAWTTCRQHFTDAGLSEPPWWVADYTRDSLAMLKGAVAHQYESTPGYDLSDVADYWPGVDPHPVLQSQQSRPSQEDMMNIRFLGDGRAVVVARSTDNHLVVYTSEGAFSGSPTQKWSLQDVAAQVASESGNQPPTIAG